MKTNKTQLPPKGDTKPQREYYARNREKRNRYQREYRAKNAEREKQKMAEYRASGRPEELRKMRQYGITEDEYQVMLKAQGGRCAICDAPMEGPHIDHDHQSGKVRGLLCFSCNTGLGHLGDDRDRLLGALTYLGRGEYDEIV